MLFHRLDLTKLYTALSVELDGKMNILHLAYSDHECKLLEDEGVVGHIVNFKSEVRAIWEKNESIDVSVLKAIDEEFIENTDGAFNLNGAIQSDRGFELLSYEESLKITISYYLFWKDYIESNEVDYILHETPSLMFNLIGVILCGNRGGKYLYNIMVPSKTGALEYLAMAGFDFTCPAIDIAYSKVENGTLPVQKRICEEMLSEYRKDLSVFLGSSISRNASVIRFASIAFRNWIRKKIKLRQLDISIDNVDYWDICRNVAWDKLINLFRYSLEVKFSDFNPDEQYFFYPFQLEPEAGVYIQGHGIYMNQVKLIQNIAAQLPPGVLLYVKDHPHDFGYRSASDYLSITKIPNIRLLKSNIPGKQVIYNSLGVMTITGTAGFEAIMLGKRVYAFGKTYYSKCPLVTYIRNIRDLRSCIYENSKLQVDDDRDLYPFLSAFLSAKRTGLIDFYGGRAEKYGVDLEQNATNIANAILDPKTGL